MSSPQRAGRRGLEIREPKLEDAEALAAVSVASWNAAYKDILPPHVLQGMTIPERRKLWEGLVERPGGLIHYVATMPRRGPVGFATFGRPRGRELRRYSHEIFSFYIDPEFQRQGIGTRLLARCFERMQADGGHSACLWVLDANRNGVSFYRGAGGEEVARGTGVIEGVRMTGIVFAWTDLETARITLDLAARAADEAVPSKAQES